MGVVKGAAEEAGRPEPASDWIVVAGRHPVVEALSAGQRIKEILVAEGVRGGVDEIESDGRASWGRRASRSAPTDR